MSRFWNAAFCVNFGRLTRRKEYIMPNRRRFLKTIPAVPALGAAASASAKSAPKRDYFKELGVRPFINAAGTYTTLSASLMLPEVMETYLQQEVMIKISRSSIEESQRS